MMWHLTRSTGVSESRVSDSTVLLNFGYHCDSRVPSTTPITTNKEHSRYVDFYKSIHLAYTHPTLLQAHHEQQWTKLRQNLALKSSE